MKNGTISIKNWNEFQHYKDRNPPWIKFYHSLLDDYSYACLRDDSKLLLISLYLLAAKTGNKIPYDLKWIQTKAMLNKKPNLTPLIEPGFVSLNGLNDSNEIAECKQDDSLRREEKRRDREETENSDSKFDIFWKAYPKKKSKGQAEKAWFKIKPNQSLLNNILSAIDNLKRTKEWKKDGGQFIPYPATWLNAKGWEDEVEIQQDIIKLRQTETPDYLKDFVSNIGEKI